MRPGDFLAAACTRDLVPRPGTQPGRPALGAWSLTHRTTREVPNQHILSSTMCWALWYALWRDWCAVQIEGLTRDLMEFMGCPCGCRNKLLRTRSLKTTEVYPLIVPEARSSKEGCQGRSPSRGPRGGSFPAVSRRSGAPDVPWIMAASLCL